MPLSEEEQRLLEQMEEALAAEDPKFASALRGAAARSRNKRIVVAASFGFVVGIVVLMTGAVITLTVVAVAGFVMMLSCAWLALTRIRRLREPDLPEGVHHIDEGKKGQGGERQSGFMNRMEDRWRRRRDEY